MKRRSEGDLLVGLAILAGMMVYAHPQMRERWPLFAAGGTAIATLAALVYIWWRRRTSNTLLGQLAFTDRMKRLTWEEFERACAVLFERQGFRTSLTPATDDGIDIILRRDGSKSVVQCKHYPDRHVGAPMVRELLGAKQDFSAENAYMLTSGYFSGPARDLANRNSGLILWDGAHICRVAAMLAVKASPDERHLDSVPADMTREPSPDTTSGHQPAAISQVEEHEPSPEPEADGPRAELCPRCGEKLVIRDGRYGRFIGCTGYPKCRYTRDLNAEDREPIGSTPDSHTRR